MPWCELFETDDAPRSVNRALHDLHERVDAAMARIGHPNGFTFGRILGTPVENLYSALNVDLSYGNAWLSGRPRLERLGVDRSRYNAPPTRAPGRSHRDYQLASDLLRALCWQELRTLVQDDSLLNLICRNFADGWLFGHPVHFARKLEQFDSVFGIHAEWDIPLSALAAFTAKLRQDEASVDTLILVSGPNDIQPKPVYFHRLGVRRNASQRVEEVGRLLRASGRTPSPGARSMQFVGRAASGAVTLINASAGITPVIFNDRSQATEDAYVQRFVFASVPRLPTSVRGALN